MNVSLTAELDRYVVEKVESGLYHSASEVIREGLRLLKEQDALRQARLKQLGQDIDLATNQIENGQYNEFSAQELPALAQEIKAKGRQRRIAKAAP